MTRTMTDAEIAQLVRNVNKRRADAASKAATETTQPLPVAPEPTSSQATDDAFLAQDAAYQNRGLQAFGEFIEGKNDPEPDLKGPGNPYNGRAWANLAEILEKEQAERAAKASRR